MTQFLLILAFGMPTFLAVRASAGRAETANLAKVASPYRSPANRPEEQSRFSERLQTTVRMR